MQSASGLIGTPIDVEAIEDDIQLLSSKRMFPAGTHHQLRRSPVTVVIDDDLELNLRHSDITTLESVPALSANCHNREKISTNRKIISSDLCLNFEDHDGMGKNVRKSSHPKPSKAPMLPLPPKELTFTCPVCLNPLVEPSSTTCGHIFCLPCIKESVEKHKKCPICQKELTANNFHRVYFPTATDD